MARSVNKVILLGNLTRDPELKYTPQGHAVCTFGVATNREWVSNGEKQEAADFHNIVAWNKLAELCSQLLSKGAKEFLEGRIQTRSWEGEDKVKKYRTEIVIDEMIVLTGKGATAGAGVGTGAGEGSQEVAGAEMGYTQATGDDAAEDIASDEVPF